MKRTKRQNIASNRNFNKMRFMGFAGGTLNNKENYTEEEWKLVKHIEHLKEKLLEDWDTNTKKVLKTVKNGE